MATIMTTTYVSDLSGSEEDVRTVRFGFEGVSYEIDLTEAEATDLSERLADFINAGRRVGRIASTATKPRSKRGNSDAEAIRAWAKENGITVSERGRISADVRAKYEAAGGK